MNRKSILFLLLLLGTLLLVFGIHVLILKSLEKPLFEHKIVLSYFLNYLLAVVVLIIVKVNLKKKSSQSGFIFMAGSGLKFLIFFLFFYPSYKEDGVMAGAEFAAFFIPYAVCLTLEVAYLSKLLNNQSYSDIDSEEKKK
ncbi:DUF6168 family protein [Ulvibacter litoralis]|uniref:Uncharacterized protein n=1 Tax=Ulvibacter litoralis TaxID=227084 RepID=A0A1G7D6G4_9FLAO|nr:DUF6168 family protein [Ulvibacter litoralis]GHC44668.1 hypothetical protein GCM10008083_04060 [Ulvibacter litoralis]SDE47218.1 hypothetical protein SAMN05421855_101800 [Ulvibacter litoralis]